MKIEVEKNDMLRGFPLWMVMVDGEQVIVLRTENEAVAMATKLSTPKPGVVDDAGDDADVTIK